MSLISLLTGGGAALLTQAEWDPPEWYPVLFDSPMNIARGAAFWATIALALAFLVCVLVLKGDTRKKFLKASLIFAIAYACALAVMFLTFTFIEDGIVTILFAPLVVLVVVVAAGIIALVFRRTRADRIIVACHIGAAVIATLVCIGIYYNQNIAEDGYYNSDLASVNQIVLYVSAVVLLALILFFGFFFNKGTKGFDSKSISYAAVCIAMSFALSYVRLVKLPQGGSITVASLLPLMIYSYMFGTKKGVFAGLVYGAMQALQDPYIIHPAQFLLDYPIAFSAIGTAGLFAQTKSLNKLPQLQFALGAVVASVLRFAAHVLSGVFAFEAYAVDAGMNAWFYSLAYNSFVFADIAIAIAAGVLVFSSRSFMRQARKFFPSEKEVPAAETEGGAQTEAAAGEAPEPAQPAAIDAGNANSVPNNAKN